MNFIQFLKAESERVSKVVSRWSASQKWLNERQLLWMKEEVLKDLLVTEFGSNVLYRSGEGRKLVYVPEGVPISVNTKGTDFLSRSHARDEDEFTEPGSLIVLNSQGDATFTGATALCRVRSEGRYLLAVSPVSVAAVATENVKEEHLAVTASNVSLRLENTEWDFSCVLSAPVLGPPQPVPNLTDFLVSHVTGFAQRFVPEAGWASLVEAPKTDAQSREKYKAAKRTNAWKVIARFYKNHPVLTAPSPADYASNSEKVIKQYQTDVARVSAQSYQEELEELEMACRADHRAALQTA